MNSRRLFIIRLIFGLLPATRCAKFKSHLLRWAGAAIGHNVRCTSSANFLLTGALRIGTETWIGHEFLAAGGDALISIGAYCDIGPRVSLISGSHRINLHGPRVAGAGYSETILIGEGCWICAGATILGGTTLGARSIVAAGAVVKGDFPPGCLSGGIPARVLRNSLTENAR